MNRERSASKSVQRILLGVVVLAGGLMSAWPTAAQAQSQSAVGFGREWLLLGEYSQAGGGAPGLAAIRQDFLAEAAGGATEASFYTVMPAVGRVLNTNYGGNPAFSTAYVGGTLATVFPAPTVFYYYSPNGDVFFNNIFGAQDNLMDYAWCIARNKTGVPYNCIIGASSDDSIQVLVNGTEILISNLGRGRGSLVAVQTTGSVTLQPGDNVVMVKIFDGTGDHGFSLRLQTNGSLTASAANTVPVADAELLVNGTPAYLGFGQDFLLLGQYARTGGANPGVAVLQQDYLFESAAVNEATYYAALPSLRQVINTAFNANPAFSTRFISGDVGFTAPTVFYWYDPDDTINYNDVFGPTDNIMVYAWANAVNKTASPISCYLGVSSDDSVQVRINGIEAGVNNIARGYGAAATTVLDVYPVTLNPGNNTIMVKTFDGGGDFGFRLRLQTDNMTGVAFPFNTVPQSQAEIVIWPDTAMARRNILSGGVYAPSIPMDVAVTVTRGRGTPSPTVVENVPAGWTISAASASLGTPPSVAGTQITWNVGSMASTGTATLNYRVTPPAVPSGNVLFTGTITVGAMVDSVVGDQQLRNLALGMFDWHGDIGDDPVGMAPGNPSTPGGATEAAGVYSVTGAGADVWGDVDRCHLAAKQVAGNFVFEGDITWTDPNTNTWSKAGIMCRASIDSRDVHTWMGIRNPANAAGANEGTFQWRDTRRSASVGNEVYMLNAAVGTPLKVRLTRRGNTFFSFAYDTAAGAWINYGTHVNPGVTEDVVAACLFVTSHQDNSTGNIADPALVDTASANFSNLAILPVAVRSAVRTIIPTSYILGTPVPVTIDIAHALDAPSLIVTEVLPPGWVADQISQGGTQAGDRITWNLSNFTTNTQVTYTAFPAFTFDGRAVWGSGGQVVWGVGFVSDAAGPLVAFEGENSLTAGDPRPTIAYWPMDENTGTIANDIFANHDGTLQAGATWVAAAKFGSGVSFNGTDTGWINCNPSGYWSSLRGSVSLWFNTTFAHVNAGMMFYGVATNGGDGFGGENELHLAFETAANANRIRGFCEGSTDRNVYSPTTMTLNNGVWHHAVLTWDQGSDFVLYVDGVEVGRQNNFALANDFTVAANTRMGRPYGTGSTRYYNGMLDDVHLYSYALNNFEVLALYSATPAPPSAPTNLAATAFGGTILLQWNDTADNEDGFVIQFRRAGTTLWVDAVVTGPSASSALVRGLEAQTDYEFRVRAYNALGFSAYSNVVTAQAGNLSAKRWGLYH